MKGAPLKFAVFVAGAWLTTLGACGRTLPLSEDNFSYVNVSGDTGNGASENGGGGTSNGGTHNTGGTGGNPQSGGTGGGPSTGGAGGDIAPFGGTGDRSTGGSIGRTGGTGGGGKSGLGGRAAGGRSAGGRPAAGRGGGGGLGATGGQEMTAGASGFPNISCDGSTCDPDTFVCCKRRGSPSTCELIATGCSSGATLTCSGSGQCGAGQVCCFHFNSSACADSCDVSEGSPGNPPTVVLCDSNADCSTSEICVIAPRGIAYCASAVQ